MKDFFKDRIFGIRPSILAVFALGVLLACVALIPDTNSRIGWIVQYPRDLGYVLTGLVLLYASNLAFGHLRMHKLIKRPDDYSWKHVALVTALLISCSHIIASILG